MADMYMDVDAALVDVGLTTTITGRIDAAISVRTLASADYATATALATVDTVVDAILVDSTAIKAKTDSLTFTVAGIVDSNTQAMATGVVNAAALASDAVNEIADGLLDRADAIETGMTLRQAERLNVAAAAGKLSGAATTTVVIRNAVADSKNRITATVDADGNRYAITTDLT